MRSKNLGSIMTCFDHDLLANPLPLPSQQAATRQFVRFNSTIPSNPTNPTVKNLSLFEKLWGIDSCTAAPEFNNRWMMVVPAFLSHMAIG
jgi:hypothetical protein